MSSVGYFEAWSRWFSGEHIDPQLHLGFMTVLWWGRLGKVLAFIGGLTVILDLVGPERLRRISKDRKRLTTGAKITAHLVFFAIFIAASLPIARSVAPSIELYEDPSIAEVFRHYWDAVYSKDLIAVYIAGYIALALYFLISRYLPRILANALDKPSPAHGIRVVAVFMIAVGFHFDLLAS